MTANTKKQQIINTALMLSVEKGVDAVSTLDISKRSGVAKSTMFHHFPTKADIIGAVYDSIKHEFDFFGAPQSLVMSERVSHIWKRNLQWALNNPDKVTFLNMYYTASAIDDDLQNKAKSDSTKDLYSLIEELQEHSCLEADTELLCEVVYSHFMTTALLLKHKSESESMDCISTSLSILRRILFV